MEMDMKILVLAALCVVAVQGIDPFWKKLASDALNAPKDYQAHVARKSAPPYHGSDKHLRAFIDTLLKRQPEAPEDMDDANSDMDNSDSDVNLDENMAETDADREGADEGIRPQIAKLSEIGASIETLEYTLKMIAQWIASSLGDRCESQFMSYIMEAEQEGTGETAGESETEITSQDEQLMEELRVAIEFDAHVASKTQKYASAILQAIDVIGSCGSSEEQDFGDNTDEQDTEDDIDESDMGDDSDETQPMTTDSPEVTTAPQEPEVSDRRVQMLERELMKKLLEKRISELSVKGYKGKK